MRDSGWSIRAMVTAGWVALAASAVGQLSGGPPPAQVRMDVARIETVAQVREVTGELRAVRRALVATREEGLVAEIAVEAGDWVEAGALLAKLDERLRRLDLEERAAQSEQDEGIVREQTAQLDKARRDLARLREAQSKNGASQNEVDDAQTGVDEAEARLAQAKAELQQAASLVRLATQRLEDLTIRAPFSGSVVAKSTEVGQWVSEGDPIVEVVEVERIDAWLDVPEAFATAIVPGKTTIEVQIAATGQTLSAPVSTVLVAGDRLGRTFPVRVRLANPDGVLRSGMSVTARVPTGESGPSLTIHKDAIKRDEAGAFVYAEMGGASVPLRVQPLFATGGRVVIRPGAVQAGMRLITEGNERVFPGQPLIDMGAPAASPAGQAGGREQR